MPSKKFLSLILISLFFFSLSFSTINAQTPTPPPTSTTQTSWWDSILSLLGLVNTINGNPVKKSTPIDTDVSENLNYNSPEFDQTTRSRSSKDQKIDKGKYLFQVINKIGGYPDKEYQPAGCNPLKLTQVAYYFYKNNQKILYNLDGNLVDYDSAIMDAYNYNLSEQPNSCYTDFYDRMPSTPQGAFYDKDDTAAANSTQLNYTQGDFIPAKYQSDIPKDNSTQENTEKIVNNNDSYEINNIKWSSPQSELEKYNIGTTDRDYDRSFISHLKNPDSWQSDELPERTDDNLVGGDIDTSMSTTGENVAIDGRGSSSGSCNAKSSHCRGMSQYGAYGMAKSGKTYQEILKFYYGDIAIKTISTSSDVKVRFDKGDKDCSAGQTRAINIEQYLLGLGEMPEYWGKLGMEALKAQIVAARTYSYVRTKAFQNSICNTSSCQVFRCTNLNTTARKNIWKAVQETAGQVIVDATHSTAFSTEYARSFCGASKKVTFPNHIIPAVDAGTNMEYERKGNNGKNAFCK